MSNSERFLSAFNIIEQLLKKDLNDSEHYKGFSELLKTACESNAIIKRHREKLRQFATLRNAIIHEKIFPNFVIAEPHDIIVDEIIKIQIEIANPEKVIPNFSSAVKKFDINASVADVLRVVRDHNFSQFPLYDQRYFKGVLSDNGITNWLARNIENDLFSLSETKLSEVLSFQEAKQNYKFINRDMTIYDAKELFQKLTFEDSPKPDALLITESGKPTEGLLGIITSWDIINIK